MAQTSETVQETRVQTAEPADQPGPPKRGFHERRRSALKNPRVRLGLIIAAVIIVLGGILAWRYFSSYQSTDDAQIDGHINPISPRVSGHVIKLNVNDNQYVQAGTVLVEIDPTDFELAVARAKATLADAVAAAAAAHVNVPVTSISATGQVSTAQADVNNARAGVSAATQQYHAAKARLTEAQANNNKAQTDVLRFKQLVQKQEISEQQYDQAVATAASTAATVQAGQANVSAAEQQVIQAQGKLDQALANLRTANTAPKQVEMIRSRAAAADAEVQRREADLKQAELNLTYTKVVAPVAGEVSNRTVEVGQNVQAGQQMLTIVPLEDVWVTANFKESELRGMRPGQAVTIHVDAPDRSYKGHVDSIAGASGARFSLLPPENATGNYVKVVQRIPVKITFDSGELQGHELRPGMSCEPKVWLR
jgi:membrane fusion protein (multidrug efflux system)